MKTEYTKAQIKPVKTSRSRLLTIPVVAVRATSGKDTPLSSYVLHIDCDGFRPLGTPLSLLLRAKGRHLSRPFCWSSSQTAGQSWSPCRIWSTRSTFQEIHSAIEDWSRPLALTLRVESSWKETFTPLLLVFTYTPSTEQTLTLTDHMNLITRLSARPPQDLPPDAQLEKLLARPEDMSEELLTRYHTESSQGPPPPPA